MLVCPLLLIVVVELIEYHIRIVFVCVCVCLSDALFLGHGKLTRRKKGTNGFGATLRRLL